MSKTGIIQRASVRLIRKRLPRQSPGTNYRFVILYPTGRGLYLDLDVEPNADAQGLAAIFRKAADRIEEYGQGIAERAARQ